MSSSGPRAHCWQVNGLTVSGLSWGEPGASPLLALHGWLDNAASFSLLAPLLADHHVVALDLTGHGQSDWRCANATYQIWDDLPEILGVAGALGWQDFSVMGHSRGAIIGALLAATVPERVPRLVLLDAIMPEPLGEAAFPEQMRRFLEDKARLQARKSRVYDTVEQAAASRRERGLSALAARLLVERNLRPCDGGVTWTTDPRLQGASAVKLTDGQIQAVLSRLAMPTLLMLAEGGPDRIREMTELARRHVPDLEVATVSGGHHFHMETGVTGVAAKIRRFLQG
jgi:pimeloyl-ACP methyl ester carboxylesterase